MGSQRRRRPVLRQAAGPRAVHGGPGRRAAGRRRERTRRSWFALPPGSPRIRLPTDRGRSRAKTNRARRRPTDASWPPTWPARACGSPIRSVSASRSIAPGAGCSVTRSRPITDASVMLLATASAASPRVPSLRGDRRLELLRKGQSDEGGWGPFVASPPEVYDTALAVLALATAGDSPSIRATDRPRPGLPDRPPAAGRELDRDHPASRVRRATPSGSRPPAGPPGPARHSPSFTCAAGPTRNGNLTVSVVTCLEIGPTMSTSNGRPTPLPARSSSSVPITSLYSPAFHRSRGVKTHRSRLPRASRALPSQSRRVRARRSAAIPGPGPAAR